MGITTAADDAVAAYEAGDPARLARLILTDPIAVYNPAVIAALFTDLQSDVQIFREIVRAARNNHGRRRDTKARKVRGIEMLRDGATRADVAYALDVAPATVSVWARESGITTIGRDNFKDLKDRLREVAPPSKTSEWCPFGTKRVRHE